MSQGARERWLVSTFDSLVQRDKDANTLHSAIFQAGSLLVLIAEVRTRAFLASLVPVIVNSVLNEHQLVLDIVAFVALGDFPRSRLGEKQRGKVLASWVSRKMRTIAQFSIRDPEVDGSVGTVVPEEAMARRGSAPRSFRQSGASGIVGGGGSSLRHAESIAQMPLVEEPAQYAQQDHLTVEINPAFAQQRRVSSPGMSDFDRANDNTPTNENPNPYSLNTTLDYSPVDPGNLDTDSPQRYASQTDLHQGQPGLVPSDMSSFDYHPGLQSDARASPQPSYHQQPIGVAQGHTSQERQYLSQQQQQQQQSQGYHGRDLYFNDHDDSSPVDVPQALNGGRGLRVANRASGESEEDWGAAALRHMNLDSR